MTRPVAITGLLALAYLGLALWAPRGARCRFLPGTSSGS